MRLPCNGPQDVTVATGASLNDIGYNLVDLTDTTFNKAKDDVFAANSGLTNALAQNGRSEPFLHDGRTRFHPPRLTSEHWG